MSTALVILTTASPAPNALGNPGDNPNHVGPGAVAFWIVIALGVGLFLLIKSMGRQMKRIDFEEPSDSPGGPGSPRVPRVPAGPAGPAGPAAPAGPAVRQARRRRP